MLMVGNVCGFIKYVKRSMLICGKVDYLITQPTPNPYCFTLTLTKCCWDVGLKPLSSLPVLFIQPNITNHKFASRGFIICTAHNSLYPQGIKTDPGPYRLARHHGIHLAVYSPATQIHPN